jgi:hypothetical protein
VGVRGVVLGRGPAREGAVGLLLVAELEGHVSGRRDPTSEFFVLFCLYCKIGCTLNTS